MKRSLQGLARRPGPKLFVEVLDATRRAMLPPLAFLRTAYGFYLAGGAALALQIGHRRSIDFDFYTPRPFDPKALHRQLARRFHPVASTHVAEGTLMVVVQGINMSFFQHDYPLLKPLVRAGSLDLLSAEDIAAMKIIAIAQRGTRRDFVDVHALLGRYGLDALLRMTERKYAVFNRYIGLRALTYFDDAEDDHSRRRLETLEHVGWDRVTRDLVEAVRQYRKRHLRHR